MQQYRMNDSLKMIGHYKSIAPNEVREGKFVEYFESGDVLEESIFDKGNKVAMNKRFYPGGKSWFIGEFAAGLPIGEHRWFNEDGSKHRIEKYSKGKLTDGFASQNRVPIPRISQRRKWPNFLESKKRFISSLPKM